MKFPPQHFVSVEVSLPGGSLSYFRLGREFGFRVGFQFDVGLALERDHHFPEILDSTFFSAAVSLPGVSLNLGVGFNFILGVKRWFVGSSLDP